jgi:hypothetical protein
MLILLATLVTLSYLTLEGQSRLRRIFPRPVRV